MINTVTFTGRRPKDLFGYYNKEPYQRIVDKLKTMIESAYNDGARNFITGGAQGFDQMAFWAVNSVKQKHPDIKNILYIPHEKQADAWSNNGLFSKSQHTLMQSIADEVRIISKDYNIDTSDNRGIIRALMKRNEAMVDKSDLIIGLYPHDLDYHTEKGGTAACLRYAMDQDYIGVKTLDPISLSVTIERMPKEKQINNEIKNDLDFN